MSKSEQQIPLVDLKAQYQGLKSNINEAVQAVFERGDFILGEDVSRFEKEFAEFCGARFGVGCGSGTDALHLACRALEIGSGDEVILPAFTFVATALGVTLSGAKPVLVDVDPETALIDVKQMEKAITSRTRAILPVHLYGQCLDMQPLLAIAEKHDLRVIEDAAQAHGAENNGKRGGSFGALGCFSFYPGKNLGAYGDGGMIITNDELIDEKLRLLRNWGSRKKYHHEEPGLNSRLDTVQAAILRVKLKQLDGWNEKRRQLAARYDNALREIDGIEMTKMQGTPIYHLYVIRLHDEQARNRALEELQAAGIHAGIHYPFAVHELQAYRWLGYKSGAFPVAEDWARRCLSLPIYAEMPEAAISRALAVLSDVG